MAPPLRGGGGSFNQETLKWRNCTTDYESGGILILNHKHRFFLFTFIYIYTRPIVGLTIALSRLLSEIFACDMQTDCLGQTLIDNMAVPHCEGPASYRNVSQ